MAKATNPMFDTEAFKVPDFTKFYGDFNKAAADFGKLFVNGKAPMFDFEAAIAAQRKNVEAFTAANRIAVEGTQAVLRRQAELVREAIEELSSVSKEFTAAGSAEDKLLKQAELAKSAFENALANVARALGPGAEGERRGRVGHQQARRRQLRRGQDRAAAEGRQQEVSFGQLRTEDRRGPFRRKAEWPFAFGARPLMARSPAR